MAAGISSANQRQSRAHGPKYGRQYIRTARNIKRRREIHAGLHPNDKKARINWENSPVKLSSGG